MENIEIKEELTPAKKTGSKGPILTPIEAGVLARRGELNFPALQAFYGLSETELKTILDKLPPMGDCNC